MKIYFTLFVFNFFFLLRNKNQHCLPTSRWFNEIYFTIRANYEIFIINLERTRHLINLQSTNLWKITIAKLFMFTCIKTIFLSWFQNKSADHSKYSTLMFTLVFNSTDCYEKTVINKQKRNFTDNALFFLLDNAKGCSMETADRNDNIAILSTWGQMNFEQFSECIADVKFINSVINFDWHTVHAMRDN